MVNVPQQGGKQPMCGMACVVLGWCRKRGAEMVVALPSPPVWSPALLPCPTPPWREMENLSPTRLSRVMPQSWLHRSLAPRETASTISNSNCFGAAVLTCD